LEELIEILKESLPIELKITRKDGRTLKIYFQNLQGVRDFQDFISELISSVKEKTEGEQRRL